MFRLEDHFVTYDQALELKKLGFDEPCLYNYRRDIPYTFECPYTGKEVNMNADRAIRMYKTNERRDITKDTEFICVAPLNQQAIEFLVSKIDGCSITYYGEGFGIVNLFEIDPIPFAHIENLISLLINELKNEIS